MEISENEENKKANPLNNPHPLQYVHIYVHISAGTGLKKEVYIHFLKPI